MSAVADLESTDASTVLAALARLRGTRPSDAELAAIERLLADTRVHREDDKLGPTYRVVAEAAIAALVEAGPCALPMLERAKKSALSVDAPDPSYDQGVYIGDYGSRTFVVASAAAEAIRRIGNMFDGSVPWIGMKQKDWLACRDASILVRAVFDRSEHSTLKEHLRGFLAAPWKGHSPDVDAAISLAEHTAFGRVTADQMTAARAAALHADVRAVALALALDLDVERALEALALHPSADADLLRRSIPLWRTVDPPPPRVRGSWDPLLDAVIASLDDDAPRLAFAEWLTARGDPRGEYIRLQCTNGSRERQAELVGAHLRSWTRWPEDASFGRGFVEATGSNLMAFRDEPTARAVGSWRGSSSSFVDAIASMPEAPRIRRITIRGGHVRPLDLTRLCASTQFTSLRELTMQGCDLDMKCIELLASWPAIEQLTHLDLGGNGLPPEARKLLPPCEL